MADQQQQFTDDDWAAVLDAVRANPKTAMDISKRLTPEQAQAFVDYQKRAVKPANPGGDNTAISFKAPGGDIGIGIGDVLGGGLLTKAAGPAVSKALANPLVGGAIGGIEGYRRGGPLQGLEWGLGGALGQKVGGPILGKLFDSVLPGAEASTAGKVAGQGLAEGDAMGESIYNRAMAKVNGNGSGVMRKPFNSTGGTPPVESGAGPVGGPSNPTGTTPPSDTPSAPGDAPATSIPPSRESSSLEASGGSGEASTDVSRRLPPDSILSDSAVADRLAAQGGSPSDQLASRFDSWLRQNPGQFKIQGGNQSAEDLASTLGPGKVVPGSLKEMPFPKGSGVAEKALRQRANFLDSLQKQFSKDPQLIRDDQLRSILEDMMKTRSQ